jgi:flagellar hook-length control protein FliK
MEVQATYTARQPVKTDAFAFAAKADDTNSGDFADELDVATRDTDVSAKPTASKPSKQDGGDPAEAPLTEGPSADAPAQDAQPSPQSGLSQPVPPEPKATASFSIDAVPAAPTQNPNAQNVTAPLQSAPSDATIKHAAPIAPVDTAVSSVNTTLPSDVRATAGDAQAAQPKSPALEAIASKPDELANPVAAKQGEPVPAASPNAAASLANFAMPTSKPASGAQKAAKGDTKDHAASPAAPVAANTAPASAQQVASQTAAATASTQNHTQPQGQQGQTSGGSSQTSASAAAAGQAQATPTQPGAEFKLDASAAALAPQPASPSAPNAPTAAPALVAQNAPVLVPPEALGVVIARKALEGVNKFEMRLDPPELGRLDVTLEVDEHGATRAHIRAERPEALELLQREAKGMEQALRQAGLQFDQSNLTFSLGGREGREAQEHANNGRKAKFSAVLPEDEIHASVLRGNAPNATGVDLRV